MSTPLLALTPGVIGDRDRRTVLGKAVVAGAAAIVAVGALSPLAARVGSVTAGHVAPIPAAEAAPIPNATAAGGLGGLLSLPAGDQLVLNRDLGANNAPFDIRTSTAGLVATSPTYGFQTSFAPTGVTLRAGGHTLGVALAGLGRGPQLAAVAPTEAVRTGTNTLSYPRPGLVERYEHGPLGLAHSITVGRAPAGDRARPLTAALTVSGDLNPTISADGRSAAFTSHGKAVFGYRDLQVLDASGRALPARLDTTSTGTSALIVRVDDRGATYPLTIDPIFSYANNVTGGNQYGYSVSVEKGAPLSISQDRTYLAVGDPQWAGAQGRVFLYFRNDTTPGFSLTQKKEWDGTQGGAKFGFSLDMMVLAYGTPATSDGPRVVIGAPLYDKLAFEDGAMFVGDCPNGSCGSTLGRLYATDGKSNDQLGYSVAINRSNGRIIVGGQPLDDYGDGVGAVIDAGSARVWEISTAAWPIGSWIGQNQGLVSATPPTQAGAQQGFSVDISDDGTAIITGEPYRDGQLDPDDGTAYIFLEPGGSGWQSAPAARAPSATLKQTSVSSTAGIRLGYSVAISGDKTTAVAGATENPAATGFTTVTVKPAGGWSGTITANYALTLGITGAANDQLGASVAVSANGARVAVGAPNREVGTVPSVPDAGSAFIWERPAGGWPTSGSDSTPDQTMSAGTGAFVNGYFGKSVAMSANGARIAVGSPASTGTAELWIN